MKTSRWALAMAMGIALGITGSVIAQDKSQKPPKEKKDAKMKAEQVEPSQALFPPGNDNEQIDIRIAEMLAAASQRKDSSGVGAYV